MKIVPGEISYPQPLRVYNIEQVQHANLHPEQLI